MESVSSAAASGNYCVASAMLHVEPPNVLVFGDGFTFVASASPWG